MEQKNQQDPAQAQAFLAMVVAFSMAISVGMFFFLAWENSQNPDRVAVENPQTIVFTSLACLLGLLSFVLPLILMPKKPKRDETGKKIKNPANLFVPAILSYALSEAVGIMGFLASHQTKDFELFIPFGICAMLLLLIHGFRFTSKIKVQQKQRI